MVGDSRRAGGIAVFARTEWRARGWSHAVVALLAAMTVVVVMATLCAADRSRTAFERLRDETDASDVAVDISSGNPERTVQEVRGQPGVIDARAMSNLFVRPQGMDLIPTLTITAIAPRLDDRSSLVDDPVVTDGRAPRADRPAEVALSATLAKDLGVRPGEEVRLETMTRAWIDTSFAGKDPGAPDGPTVTVTVTGIARSPADFGQRASVIHLTPAFIDRYEDRVGRFDAIHARLDPEGLERFYDGNLLLVVGSSVQPSTFIDLGTSEDGLGTIAIALRLVGLVTGVAGALTLTLALARTSRGSSADRSTLVALGWTRSDELCALSLAFAPPVMAGLCAGVAIGVFASPRAMVGLARSMDPRPGSVLVSPRLVLAVAVGAVIVAAVVLAVVAVLTVRRRPRGTRRVVRIPMGPPLALTFGLRDALVAPADRGGRASRAAIAAVAASTGVGLAALIISSSIGRLQVDPSLTGERPERLVDSGFSIDAFDDVMARFEADDRVEVLAGQGLANGSMEGVGHVFVLINDPRRGELDASIISGRMPRAADEVALGPATAELAGAQIGDRAKVAGEFGTGLYRVVGTVLFPEGDFTHDEGVALTVDGGTPLVGDPHDRHEARRLYQVVFEWADGVDVEAAEGSLAADGITVVSSGEGLRIRPGTVNNLGQVEHLPRQLALLVGLLALATLLHAAGSGVRLRARELVTMRALGVTRRATALMTATHILAMVAVGVLVGAPIGVMLGRQTWRPIAENAHLVVRPILDWSWFSVVVGSAALVSLVVAAVAGRWTWRLRPAVDLRVE